MTYTLHLDDLLSYGKGDHLSFGVTGVELIQPFKRVKTDNPSFFFYHALCNNNGKLDCITIDDERNVFLGGELGRGF